jgi:hypothetical protein
VIIGDSNVSVLEKTLGFKSLHLIKGPNKVGINVYSLISILKNFNPDTTINTCFVMIGY